MTPPAPHRLGQPSPLTVHLGMAALACQQALLLAPNAQSPDFPWHEKLLAQAQQLGTPPDPLDLMAESARRLRLMLQGIEQWQSSPNRRGLQDAETIWQQGSTRLLDYGTLPGAAPVLVIPSLINRAYILDLTAQNSFLRYLAGRGLRPFLLDWGTPGFAEHKFDFNGYAEDRLLPALAIVRALCRSDTAILGYCMGGTLATGLAVRRPQGISSLVTLGAPWSFAGTSGSAGMLRGLFRSDPSLKPEILLDAFAAAFGLVPVDFFQLLFATLNPVQAARKFRNFALADPHSESASQFIALEDWIADGVPMAVPAARNLLIDWQLSDQPANGRWNFLGGAVNPARISLPTLILTGESDHIAPPDSAEPLARAIPRSRLQIAKTGHVGMIAGSRARAQIWDPVAGFLLHNRG